MTGPVLALTVFVTLFFSAAAGATVESRDRALYPDSSPPACPPGQEHSPVRVLVAARLITKGTPGSVIAKRGMYKPFTLPCGEREPGAIANPADLIGRVAAIDIFPGQQLTTFDFRVASGVHKVSLTSPVRAGDYLSLTVLVAPRAECTFTITEGNHSSTILPGKVGGRITWRWRVNPRTLPGRMPIIVSCGASGKLRTSVRVLPR